MSLFPTQKEILEGLKRENHSLLIQLACYRKDTKALEELGIDVPSALKMAADVDLTLEAVTAAIILAFHPEQATERTRYLYFNNVYTCKLVETLRDEIAAIKGVSHD